MTAIFNPDGTRAHVAVDEEGFVHMWGDLSGGTYCGSNEPIVGPVVGEPDDWRWCDPCRSVAVEMGVLREEASDGDSGTE